jgi:Ni2+-binding GTPase involved in maturation of urease and hydrogenase
MAADPAPMTAAPFVWRSDGRPDWRAMWESFCDLALHGGPPHRGPDRALRAPAVSGDATAADPGTVAEIRRGIWETTGLYCEAPAPGWIAVTCESPAMATWLAEAIVLENVEARAEDDRLLLVAGPGYRLDDEVKSTITVVAKTHHYWDAHGAGSCDGATAGPRQQFRCVRCGLDFLASRPAGEGARAATCPIDDSLMARWDGPPTAVSARRAPAYEHSHGPGQPCHAHAFSPTAEIERSPRGVPKPLIVGVGGPAGAGKSTLIDAIRRRLAGRLIVAVSGAGTVRADRPTPDLLLVERTGESAAATFSPDLVDATIGVLDLAAADGADAAARWRLLVVSKLDTAAARGMDPRGLERVLRERKGEGSVVLTDLTAADGADAVVAWLEHELLLGL